MVHSLSVLELKAVGISRCPRVLILRQATAHAGVCHEGNSAFYAYATQAKPKLLAGSCFTSETARKPQTLVVSRTLLRGRIPSLEALPGPCRSRSAARCSEGQRHTGSNAQSNGTVGKLRGLRTPHHRVAEDTVSLPRAPLSVATTRSTAPCKTHGLGIFAHGMVTSVRMVRPTGSD